MQNKSRKTVYCIDDDSLTLELLEMLIEHSGDVKLRQFTNAYVALDELRDAPADLILLDIMMPEMNGITAYHRIRALDKHKETPIVFVTARNRDNDLDQYRELGVPTISKPFDPIEFQKLIKTMLFI